MLEIRIGKRDKKKFPKDPVKYLTKVVTFCIIFIVLYTISQVVLSYFLEIELSPTLTNCVYTFFGTEIAACAFIKIVELIMEAWNKKKQDAEVPESQSDEVTEEVIEG